MSFSRPKHYLKLVFKYPIEALLIYSLLGVALCLPLTWSSALTGLLARIIGGYSGANRIAIKNLKTALPHLTPEEISRITAGVWETFGSAMGEYPKLRQLDLYHDPRIEIVGAEYIDQLRDDGKPAIIFSAHLSSWELAIMAATQRGIKISQVYRPANNPLVNYLVRHFQEAFIEELLAKGAAGDARKIIAALNRGAHLFLLVDQKFNGGVAVPFFGREAMTAPAAARLALRYNCPLVPARVERLGGFRFRVTYYPPLEFPKTKDERQVYGLMCQMNNIIEEWIRERPEQWLWLHRRWGK